MPAKRLPNTLIAGVLIIAIAEALLLVDLIARDFAIVPDDPIPDPATPLQTLARHAAVNMTPICWVAFLLLADAILSRRRPPDSPPRARPRRFVACLLTSVPIWLFFDWINFQFIHAWDYHNLPRSDVHRNLGYFVAFAAINPAMFLTAEFIQRRLPPSPPEKEDSTGTSPTGRSRISASPPAPAAPGPESNRKRTGLSFPHLPLILLGLTAILIPILLRDPVANLTLWLAFPLIFDPINDRLNAPSILNDLRRARYTRLIALLIAGLICGILWEFWNYYAIAKWTYSLPFLGPLEHIRYFEMPLPGMLGFPPFAVGCWAAFNTLAHALRRLPQTLRPEPLPDSHTIL